MITIYDILQQADAALMATERADWSEDVFARKASDSSHTLFPSPEAAVNIAPRAGTDDIEEKPVEWHPLIPFLPRESKVLFLGSFPPQRKRWCIDFFYPNFTNDHWRIEGLVFYNDAQHFVDLEHKRFRLKDIVAHLKQRGIGFFDTALAVRRLADNASDKFLEVVVPTDIKAMAEHLPALRAIVTTGEKATETIAAELGLKDESGKVLIPKVGTALPSPFNNIELYRLPSSSRAYPMALNKKAEAYAQMFKRYL